ncbi:amino acid adenylation domain-containing protein [Streptomyces sp. NPDC059906]|uniref:amino acid adenylation domain-containing protein n=1 Tax=Streptomyces sp. NPDC059906 TaxID=3346997 RepID=UPI00365BEB25
MSVSSWPDGLADKDSVKGDVVPYTPAASLARATTELAVAWGVTEEAVTATAYRILLARQSGDWRVSLDVSLPARSSASPITSEWDPEADFRSLAEWTDRALAAENDTGTGGSNATGSAGPSGVALIFGELQQAPTAPTGRTSIPGLSLRLSAQGFARGGELGFDTTLFDRPQVEELLRSFGVLLTAAVAAPGTAAADLPVVDAAALDRLTYSGPPPVPERATVDALFRRHVASTPEAVACTDRHGQWTYRQLDDWAQNVASALRAAGCRTGELVPVSVERDAGLLAALLGVMRAGGSYVPLDPRSPEARNRMVLRGINSRLLLAGTGDGPVADGHERILVEDCRPGADGAVDGNQWEPARTAYVIFTSGSTGQPKGVRVGHSALAHMMAAAQAVVRLQPGQACLALTTPSFDIAALELFLPLCNGATVEIASAQDARDPSAIATRLDRPGLALAQATPTMWRAVVESGWHGGTGLQVLCGGEELPSDLAARLLDRAGKVWNVYGPTESTIWSTAYEVTAPLPERLPIGRPFPGERVYVVDERGTRLAPGMIGELWIGGSGVAEGYLDDPELSAERFLTDPFTGEGRVYRTGDLAELLPDGTLRFHGRQDTQVKIRGHRIELGEIETALRADADVADAVALVQGDTSTDHRLAAFVLAAPGARPEPSALLARCAQMLPDVMVPDVCRVLASFPLTSSGKTDRAALARTDAPLPRQSEAEQLPVTETEKAVAGVFGDVLGLKHTIRTDANFFDLGGHSLKAHQVVVRLRRAGMDLALRDLFESPTIAGLAAKANSGREITPSRAGGPVPEQPQLSFAQERFWFQDQLGTTGPEHHVQAAYRITGPLDTALLEDALRLVVDRHEPLRTVFAEIDGRPVQRVMDRVPVELLVTAVEGGSDSERLHIAREFMRASFLEPFSLRSAPLFRFEVFRISEREHLLYLCMHHICTDGWSMGIVATEIMDHYAAVREGRPSTLPSVTSYRAYAHAEREHASDPTFDQQLAEVAARLADFPTATSIPLDRARPERQSVAGGTVRARLDTRLTTAVARLARECGGTVHSVLLAAYAALLHRHGADDEMVIAAPTANRNTPETERMIGVFVNTLPIPLSFDPQLPFAELVRRTHEATLDAMAAAEVPFDRVVDVLQIPRNLAALPLTQVAFVLHNAPMPKVALPGVEIAQLPLETGMSMYDLRLVATERPDGIELQLDHATAVIDATTAEQLLERFVTSLQAFLSDWPPANEPLPVAGEVVHEPYRSGAPFRPATTIPELFHEAVHSHPTDGAVSCGEVSWSYEELDHRSDAVAAALQEQGVRRGAPVAVMLDRGLELAAAILGTVKLGAFYACVDRTLPQARIDFMLQDLGCKAVLTDEAGSVQLQSSGLDILDVGVMDTKAAFFPVGAAPAPGDIAYVTYTSGTTGSPKGTLVPHRSVAGFWRDAEYATFGRGTVFLGHSSISWDALTLEFWSMVLAGGRCHFVPGSLSGPQDLVRHCTEGQADTAWLTAAFFHALVDAEPAAFSGLRQVLIGGEAVSVRHVRTFRRYYPETVLVNGYGPSECTVFTTCYAVPQDMPKHETSVPIGQPVGDRQVWIMDGMGHPVPPGVPGELCVGGDAVALGYLNRPDLTRERFLEMEGTRLYRTGDRVRRRTDGLLEFLGRNDDQVKLRGFRIELQEIERALTAHPAVHTATVVLHTDKQGTSRLAAYVTVPTTPQRQHEDLLAELHRQLRTSLPSYMIPGATAVLSELPRRATGKIDREALPEPVWRDTTPATSTAVEDNDARSRELTGIWAEVLGLETVGPDDNFFDIGGDSITSIQVVVRAREAGIEFDPKDLFTHQTVRSVLAVASAVTESGAEGDSSRLALTGKVPLAPIQRWMFALGLENVHRFPQSLLLDFTADPGERVLQRALDSVVNHHDMLRARYTEQDGRWTQEYGPTGESVPLTREVLDPARSEAEQIEEFVATAHRRIHLSTGPVFRALWIDCPGGHGKLFLVGHHVCIDGYSWNVLLDDLLRGLRTPEDEEIALPAKTSPYRDWVASLQEWTESPEATRQLEYWQAQRGRGIPWLVPASSEPRREVHTTELSEELAQQLLREVPAGYSVEPVELMIAALNSAVLENCAQRELLVELEHHGRDALREELVLDRTIGWFTSLYPMLLTAPAEPEELLKATKNAVRSLPGSGQGYGALRFLAGKDLPSGGDIRFNYLGRFDALQSLAEGVSLSSHTLGDHASRPLDGGPALNITTFTLAGRVHVRWDYRSDRMTAAQVAALADRWAERIRKLCAHCLTTSGGAPVAADFPLADVDQSALDALMEDL